MIRLIALLCLLAVPARADFVHNNLRFTLLHEAAHAVIDQYDLALTGTEENAADGFAIFVAHRMYDDAEMAALVGDLVALGRHEAQSALFDPWAQYMPESQRLSWAVCLYYGLAPTTRGAYARAYGMPPENGERCEESATRLAAYWDRVLRKMPRNDGEASFQANLSAKSLRLLRDDLLRLNRIIRLPRAVPVLAEPCGEDNAFYYPFDERIVFCSEMVPALREAARP